MKQIFRIGALLLLLLNISSAALAAGSVTLLSPTKGFEFKPGEYLDLTASDLFENFKGVMPGDHLEQEIVVSNDTGHKVRLYMKAEPVIEEHAELLSHMKLNVISGNKEIFDDTADQQGDLEGFRLLGTFLRGGSVTLTVTLDVSPDMGNEFMNKAGIVPWTFAAQEIPEEATPETGDWFQIGLWAALAAALVLAIAVILILKHRQREEA